MSLWFAPRFATGTIGDSSGEPIWAVRLTGETIVSFRLYGEHDSIASVNLRSLRNRIERVKRVSDYAAVDAEIDDLVTQLIDATTRGS